MSLRTQKDLRKRTRSIDSPLTRDQEASHPKKVGPFLHFEQFVHWRLDDLVFMMSSGSGMNTTGDRQGSFHHLQIHPASQSPSVEEAGQPSRFYVSYLTLLEQRAFRSESKQETFKIKAQYFPATGNIQYQHYIIIGVNHGIVWHFEAILIHYCYQKLKVEFGIYYPHLSRVSSLWDEGHRKDNTATSQNYLFMAYFSQRWSAC